MPFYMRILIFLLFISFLWIACNDKLVTIEPGVPKDLADSRKANITELSYSLFFDVPNSMDSSIHANIVISFVNKSESDIYLDFKEDSDHLKSVIVNGTIIDIVHVNEHILIPGKYLIDKNKIEINFIAGNLSLNRNEDYLYTLLVPARARTVFPLFDQPNLKASYQLNLKIPAEWEAVANGTINSELDSGEFKSIVFEKTLPISSYLFAFAVGKFQKRTNDNGNMTMYYRESDIEKVDRNAKEIFDLHQNSIDWLENYTGIDYPFEKFDFALIPTFQYGGMEHPGSIFYKESSLMLDESASINQQLSRASLIAHETSHMWFGDLVTMDWFNDVWLKEVFANFYAAKIVNPAFPEVNHDLRFLLSHYPSAYGVDRTKGSHPIQQKLDNLQNAGSLYGSIIYQKAPIVMRNLEAFLGPELFQEGIKEYLKKYAYGNATWDDLINIMSDRTKLNLVQWNKDWIKTAGMPHILIQNSEDSMQFSLMNGNEGQNWQQNIACKTDEKYHNLVFSGNGKIASAKESFIINPDGKTYGFLEMNEALLSNQLLIVNQVDEITRASIWMNQWENLLNGKTSFLTLFDALYLSIISEANPLILNYQLSIFEHIFWDFMNEDERKDWGAKVEIMLFEKMIKTSDNSLKRICWDSYKSVALSEKGVQNLKEIWEGNLKEFKLPLSENDKISLAYEIALKDEINGQNILSTQYEMLKNEDNRKKMKFVIPSLSSTQSVRDSVFQSLLIADNRAQEPWVISVLNHLHHPLRRNESIPYLKSSLEVIEEIKNTGDIFFPARWLGASFENHNSKEAMNIVFDYLNNHPELPIDLKNKVLQASDMLERATRLKD